MCCRTGAYSGGGENLTFNGAYCNAGQGLDVDTGVFTCPIGQEAGTRGCTDTDTACTGGTYMFQFHLATHDNKKALLSIKVNDKEIASVFDQNHKDNHKNSMAGTNVVHEVKRGDQVQSISQRHFSQQFLPELQGVECLDMGTSRFV